MKKRIPSANQGKPDVRPSEWRGEERSESTRNEEGLTRTNSPEGPPSLPDPEVRSKPERRSFSPRYQARIIREADACTEKGQVGALLRREGLYSSQLCEWRKKYRRGAQAALQENKRGRKPLQTPEAKEIIQLKKQVASLEKRLQQAETIIDIQKKISDLLGIQQPPIETNEND